MQRNGLIVFLIILFLGNLTFAQNLEWVATAGGYDDDWARGVCVDNEDNVYITGNFWKEMTFPTDTGDVFIETARALEMYVAKYNSNGELIYVFTDGSPNSIESPNGITSDADGNIYIIGKFSENVVFGDETNSVSLSSVGSYDIFISKYNSANELIWAKSIGSSDADYSSALHLDEQGNIFVSGAYGDDVTFFDDTNPITINSNGSDDMFFAKYNNDGELQFARGYGDSSPEYCKGISTDENGNIYIAGSFNGNLNLDGTVLESPGGANIFIAKADSNANIIWTKNIGDDYNSTAEEIKIDNAGNIYVIGRITGDVVFGEDANQVSISITTPSDAFIAKYDNLGNFKWVETARGEGLNIGQNITIDSNDNIYIEGIFSEELFLGSGENETSIIGSGGGDMFVAKYNSFGTFQWAQKMGGINNDSSTDITVDSESNCYISGMYNETGDFYGNNQTISFNSYGFRDLFLAAKIVVYNAMGQMVWNSKPLILNSNHCLFDGSLFNSGIYYYSLIIDGRKMATKSMVLIK